MKRPTIALCMIMKNEENNLPRLLESVEGCFDEIHITDTGSTDRSVEVAKALGATVHHFTWVNDFAAARNYSFSHAKTDYICWLDGDDVLSDKNAFIRWRDSAMETANFWLVNYHYALTPEGKPACTFIRERVLKNIPEFKWNYFVHEGVVPPPGVAEVQFATSWDVVHMRSEEDLNKDRSRNLKMFKDRVDSLDCRMKYYYAKELFECQRPAEAEEWFWKALEHKELEQHDRTVAIQYLCYSLDQLYELKKKMGNPSTNDLEKLISVAHQGLVLEPHRAEFHCAIADSYIKRGNIVDAIPSYEAAKKCINKGYTGSGMGAPVFTHADAYGVYPMEQLAKIYGQLNKLDIAIKNAEEAEKLGSKSIGPVLTELRKIKNLDWKTGVQKECDDIVISCPPGGAYPWDGEIYRQKGIGGSETAAVEVAEWMHKKTGKRVIVFHDRPDEKTYNGVVYMATNKLNEYFKEFKPQVNIAWRHTIKVTDAPTYVWSHDITTPGCENINNYTKFMCLSPFQKDYAIGMHKLPEDKLMVTRNGLNPEKWNGLDPNKKIKGKLVFPSSPDRGLKQAMLVLDKVREEIPEVELHVFYGYDNLLKAGRKPLVDTIKAMVAERPWVKFHGNIEQKELVRHMCEAEAWLYPADWYETFCITAFECLASKCYPILRPVGALGDYMKPFADQGMATLIDKDLTDPAFYEDSIKATINALKEEKWKNINFDMNSWTWESLVETWIKEMNIK